MTEAPPPRRGVALAISTLTAAMMAFELLQTVTLSLQVFADNAFFVVSIALLGLGSGGSIATLAAARNRRDPLAWLWGSAVGFGLAVVGSSALVARVIEPVWLVASAVPPFALAGLFLATAFSSWPREANRLYAVDLVGSALGCIVLVWCLDGIGDAGITVMVLAALGCASSLPLALRLGRKYVAASIGAIAVVGALAPFSSALFPYAPHPNKHHAELIRAPGVESEVEWSRWGYLGRLDVVRPGEHIERYRHGGRRAQEIASAGGRFRYLFASGDNWSYAVSFDGSAEARRLLAAETKCSPYLVTRAQASLVIGVGGGIDLFCAFASGVAGVTAAEINPLMVTAARQLGRSYWDGAFFDPRLDLRVIDGRTLAQTTSERYDVVTLSAVDTGAGLAQGALVLSESYLYTVEAFAEYLALLRPGGVIYVMRPTAQLVRVVATAVAALEARGVEAPERHVVVLGTGWESALIFRDPVTPEQVTTVTATFGKQVRYVPGMSATSPYAAYLGAVRDDAGDAWLAAQGIDYTPITDDRPFFYYQNKQFLSSDAGEALLGILRWVAVLSIVLLFAPLVRVRVPRKRARVAPALLYFFALGTGYIAIEICLIQRLALYLGHPAYSISVTLFGMLLSSGLGSLAASRITDRSRALRFVLPAIAVVVFGYAYWLDDLLAAFSFSGLGPRIALTLVVLAPAGFLMGMPFPLGVRSIPGDAAALIPWAWAVNAFASVIGSVGAVIVAINLGFGAVILIAALTYLVALVAHLLGDRGEPDL